MNLEQYQGPALLAYNNAIFTDADFESLSRLGDSLKLHDSSTTGKFGRGFNSVGGFPKRQAGFTDHVGVQLDRLTLDSIKEPITHP